MNRLRLILTELGLLSVLQVLFQVMIVVFHHILLLLAHSDDSCARTGGGHLQHRVVRTGFTPIGQVFLLLFVVADRANHK